MKLIKVHLTQFQIKLIEGEKGFWEFAKAIENFEFFTFLNYFFLWKRWNWWEKKGFLELAKALKKLQILQTLNYVFPRRAEIDRRIKIGFYKLELGRNL